MKLFILISALATVITVVRGASRPFTQEELDIQFNKFRVRRRNSHPNSKLQTYLLLFSLPSSTTSSSTPPRSRRPSAGPSLPLTWSSSTDTTRRPSEGCTPSGWAWRPLPTWLRRSSAPVGEDYFQRTQSSWDRKRSQFPLPCWSCPPP